MTEKDQKEALSLLLWLDDSLYIEWDCEIKKGEYSGLYVCDAHSLAFEASRKPKRCPISLTHSFIKGIKKKGIIK